MSQVNVTMITGIVQSAG